MDIKEKLYKAAGTLLTVNSASSFDLVPICRLLKEAYDHIERIEAKLEQQEQLIAELKRDIEDEETNIS